MSPSIFETCSRDISTASIYLENRTFIHAAQIEGSLTYKAFMRKSWRDFEPLPELRPSVCSPPQSPDIEIAIEMLHGLACEVESRVQTRICFASIALPDPLSQPYQKAVFEAAVRSIGLRQTSVTARAYLQAIVANHISKDPDYLVLVIGYSRSGLTVALYHNDADVYDELRVEYRPDLGAESHDAQGDPLYREEVTRVLRKITQPPFGKWMPERIGHIVLYGDRAGDDFVLGVSRDVIGPSTVENEHRLEPVFAGSRGAAEGSASALFWGDNVEDPEPECWRQSTLYGERQFDVNI
jgi:hypothetical protein